MNQEELITPVQLLITVVVVFAVGLVYILIHKSIHRIKQRETQLQTIIDLLRIQMEQQGHTPPLTTVEQKYLTEKSEGRNLNAQTLWEEISTQVYIHPDARPNSNS